MNPDPISPMRTLSETELARPPSPAISEPIPPPPAPLPSFPTLDPESETLPIEEVISEPKEEKEEERTALPVKEKTSALELAPPTSSPGGPVKRGRGRPPKVRRSKPVESETDGEVEDKREKKKVKIAEEVTSIEEDDMAVDDEEGDEEGEDSKGPIACEFKGCHRTFTRPWNMRRHVRSHYDNPYFTCPYDGCDREFRQQQGLTIHIRSHTGQRDYKCTSCDRTFTTAPALGKHRLVHGPKTSSAPPSPASSLPAKRRSKLRPTTLTSAPVPEPESIVEESKSIFNRCTIM